MLGFNIKYVIIIKIIYLDSITMSSLDLDIKNYDYNDLLNLFKISKNEK